MYQAVEKALDLGFINVTLVNVYSNVFRYKSHEVVNILTIFGQRLASEILDGDLSKFSDIGRTDSIFLYWHHKFKLSHSQLYSGSSFVSTRPRGGRTLQRGC